MARRYGFSVGLEVLGTTGADALLVLVQVCAFVRGELVVDLCCNQTHTYRGHEVDYRRRSLQNIFSTSKAVTSAVVAFLVDKGVLRSYSMRVVEVWPEFPDKTLTLAQLMRHEAGASAWACEIAAWTCEIAAWACEIAAVLPCVSEQQHVHLANARFRCRTGLHNLGQTIALSKLWPDSLRRNEVKHTMKSDAHEHTGTHTRAHPRP